MINCCLFTQPADTEKNSLRVVQMKHFKSSVSAALICHFYHKCSSYVPQRGTCYSITSVHGAYLILTAPCAYTSYNIADLEKKSPVVRI